MSDLAEVRSIVLARAGASDLEGSGADAVMTNDGGTATHILERPRLILSVSPASYDGLPSMMTTRPDAVALFGVRGADDVGRLAVRLNIAEAELDVADGSTGVLLVIDGAPGLAWLMGNGGAPIAGRRLAGIGWDCRGFRPRPSFEQSSETEVERLARATVLVAAAAAGVPAFDTAEMAPSGDFEACCVAARCHGFSGKLTTRPDEISVINAIFSPHR